MGRPLNKKYFANTNYATFGKANVGGEGVASITLGGTNNSSGYALNDPIEISAPDLVGGVQATAKVTELGAGNKIIAITVTEQGSGYTSVPTVTESVGGTQGTLTFTAVLTSGASARQNSIKAEAQIGAGTEVTTGDIVKQVSTTRYKVTTSDGTAVCKLVQTAALGANEMSITATDSAGGTYFVKKLTAHRVVLVPIDGTQFATGTTAKWSFTTTIADAQVTIANQ